MLRKIVFVLGSMLLLALASAQAQTPCPEDRACPEIALPDGLTGEFYWNEVPLGAGNRAVLTIDPGQQTIVVRNIQSAEAGFNELFVYAETSVSVNLRAGQTRVFNARPQKTFIRGTLALTCQPRNLKDGETLTCQVIIDGVPRGELAPNQAGNFIVEPGQRVVGIQLAGDVVARWQPSYQEQTVNITAGRTTNARISFDKQAKLTIVLSAGGVTGDIYVNDQLVAPQAATYEAFYPAGSYSIAVRNIIDPAAGGLYFYPDATASTSLSAGQERAVTVRLTKQEIPQPRPVPGAAASCYDGSFDWAICPTLPRVSNCEDVVAAGINERAAACCFPPRDGDKDGVACYGN